ncbi:MlaD family protein [Gordonia sp. MP11Mi]|uniref:MlaD family protein n=1 Tax=Gordonia sp. MP11Mi TaxID=3022769 RepID=UPI003B22641A
MAIVTVLLAALVVGALRGRTPTGDTVTMSADFTDASGLRQGDEVKVRGVSVGRVDSIEILGLPNDVHAHVSFTIETTSEIHSGGHASIKFQNMSGTRYIDAVSGYGQVVDFLPRTSTTPSFDITMLFNGLAPVLRVMSPDDVNKLTSNLVLLLQGDQHDPASLSAAVGQLSRYATDRQQAVQTLVDNVKHASDALGGRSLQVMAFITGFDGVLDQTMTVLSQFDTTSKYGPEFVDSTVALLHSIGLHKGVDIGAELANLMPTPESLAKLFGLLPQVASTLQKFEARQRGVSCSKGPAQVPDIVSVMLSAGEVVLCRK